MSQPDFWQRLRDARVVRIAVVYLGAAWFVLQVTNEVSDALSLPSWVPAVAVLLLVIGFVVVMFTAWIQGRPGTAERAAADEVPSAWELQVADIKDSLKRGELPHPTWARAIMGGVFAFALLIGIAGAYVLIKDRGRSLIPAEAVASSSPGIAVLPFSVTGASLDLWREGMVDLLTTNLDGLASLRTVNSRTVLSRWHQRVPAGTDADLPTMLAVARDAGASYALIGSAVAIGPVVRLSATLYNVTNENEAGTAQVEGAPDSVMVLVDRLSVGIVSRILEGERKLGASPNLASITTTSLPALKAYLEGMSHQRRADWPRAIAAYEQALAADTAFALAMFRLSESLGWSSSINDPRMVDMAQRAAARTNRMPAREASLVKIRGAFSRGETEMIPQARRVAENYPDDPEAWYRYGDFIWHYGPQGLIRQEDGVSAMERAVELDPTFAPYHIHVIEHALITGDRPRAEALLERYRRISVPNDIYRTSFEIMYAMSMAGQRVALDTVSPTTLSGSFARTYGQARSITIAPRLLSSLEDMARALVRRPDATEAQRGSAARVMLRRGKAAEARALVDATLSLEPFTRADFYYDLYRQGVRLEDSVYERELGLPASAPALYRIAIAGFYALGEGDGTAFERALAAGRAAAQRAAAANDSTNERYANGVVTLLRAQDLAERNRAAEAYELLESVRREVTGAGVNAWINLAVRRATGDLLAKAGRHAEAVRYFESDWAEPFTLLKLAQSYAAIGNQQGASRARALAAACWRDADPDFPPAAQLAKSNAPVAAR